MWRTFSIDEPHRPRDRQISITGIETMGIEGNPRPGGAHHIWGIVKVETDAGVYGIGETYRGTESLRLAEELASTVIGQSPLDPPRISELLAASYTGAGTVARSAMTAIETACWDIKGKFYELPVYELLGGKFRDSVEVYSDTDAFARTDEYDPYSPEAVAQAAEQVVAEGFTSIKFDLDVPTPGYQNQNTVGRRLEPVEIQHKVDMVEAAREAIGPDINLGMDCHWKFSVESAIRLGRRLEPFDLAFLEDPVHPEKLSAQRRVREAIDIPILTGENITTLPRFYDLLAADAVDVLAPDMARCGGLSEFLKIASLCDIHGVPMAPHNLTSPVGTIASVHAAAAIPNLYSVEYRGGDAPWWEDIVELSDGGPILDAGRITVPNAPGLGLTLDRRETEPRLIDSDTWMF